MRFRNLVIGGAMLAVTAAPAFAFAQTAPAQADLGLQGQAAAANTAPVQGDLGLQAQNDQVQTYAQSSALGVNDYASIATRVMSTFATFAIVFIPLTLLLVVFPIWALIKIAYKAHIRYGWTIFLPFVAPFMFAKIGGKSAWFGLIQFVFIFASFGGMVSALSSLILLAYYIWLGMLVSERFGHSKWMGIMLVLPIVNYFWLGDIAFSKNSVYID